MRGLAVTVVIGGVLGLAACGDEPRPACPEPSADGRHHWRDASGRVLILRGANVAGSAKWSEDNLPEVGPEDFERMAGWGLTAVRLLVFWEAIEPERGAYDHAYLMKVRSLVEMAHAASLEVIVDLHQDLYGSGFGGMGLPHWSCDEAYYETYEQPSQWFLGYLTPEVVACFDAFWRSVELQEAYAGAIRELLLALRDSPPLGLELMNEPAWGSYLLTDFEPQALRPFYDRLVTALRFDLGPTRVLVEPSLGHNIGIETTLGELGCAPSPWIFAPHYYPAFVEGAGYDGDLEELAEDLGGIDQESRGLRAPWVLTEFGIRNHAPGAAPYVADVLAVLDGLWASAFVWSYDKEPLGGFALLDEAGEERDVAAALIRPYVHRLNGVPLEAAFDPATRTYTARFGEAGSPWQPTELVAPAAVYPDGVAVALSDGHHEVHGNRVLVWSDPSEAEHTVTLSPRP